MSNSSVWLKPRSISHFFTFPYYTSRKHWNYNPRFNTARWKHARSRIIVVNVFGLWIQQWLLRVKYGEGASKNKNHLSNSNEHLFMDFTRDCNKNRAQNVHATLLHYRCSTNPEFTRFKEIIHNLILHRITKIFTKMLQHCRSRWLAAVPSHPQLIRANMIL